MCLSPKLSPSNPTLDASPTLDMSFVNLYLLAGNSDMYQGGVFVHTGGWGAVVC
jgi:hypothetical protein